MVRTFLLALVVTAFLAPAAQAACTNTYSGPSGGEWQVAANWSLGHIPTSAEDVCVSRDVVIVERGIATGRLATIAAGAKVTMRTDPGFAHTQASFAEVDNAGTFEFVATGTAADNDSNELTVGTFSNRGTLRTAQNEGYTAIRGNVTNTGTVAVTSRLRLLDNGAPITWLSSGTITVTGELWMESGHGGTLRQTGGTLTNAGDVTFWGSSDQLAVSGGTFLGSPVTLRQGSLALTGGTGTARIHWGAASLATDVAAGWTIRIEDRSSDWVRLRVPAGQTRTNAGTIVFARDPIADTTNRVGVAIDVLDGAKLINTGTIRADANVVAEQRIIAPYSSGQSYPSPTAFVQNGVLEVHHALAVPPFTQGGGTTSVDAGVRFTVGAPLQNTDPGLTLNAGTITGGGRVSARRVTNRGGVVAPTPALDFSYNNIWETETQGGDYVQEAGGTLRTRLSAAGSGLSVGGVATLGGAWDVAPALGHTPPAGQTYAVVRTLTLGSRRVGTFAHVVGAYAPTYELDGADVTVPGGSASFSVDDVAVREGETFTFTVRRSSGAGAAAVRWSARDTGSAQRASDYPEINGGFPLFGDLTFAAGETAKTVTTVWTANDGAPEPDETFQFHLSHPTTVPISRATATATILNDDTSLTSVAPNVLSNGGPATVTLRGEGLTSQTKLLLRRGGRPDIAPLSFVPADDGRSATAVFDTTTATPLDASWFIEARTYGIGGGSRLVSLQAATGEARPYVQATGPAFARGGLPSDDYLYFGNLGAVASRPAAVRLSGYPVGADLAVDHLPPGATAGFYDGVKGRTVVVSLGRVPARSSDFVRIRYTPTTTIAGHTKLNLQAAMTFTDAIPALTDARTFTGATLLPPSAGSLVRADLTFSGGGSLRMTYSQAAADGAAPTVTHTGTSWTFAGTLPVAAAPAKAVRASVDDPTKGLLKVDFNGGEFKITGPLQQVEGAYELSIQRLRLTECMKDLGFLNGTDYEDLKRLAEGAVVMKGMVSAAGASSELGNFSLQLGALDAVMSGAWEMRVAGGPSAVLDNIANTKFNLYPEQDDEWQLLWMMQLCTEHDKPVEAPDPQYDKDGNFIPPPFVKELLQSHDPNEKAGTPGGGAAHAVRSDKPLHYRVSFENLPAASAAAQTVRVTDPLDPAKLDLSTFALGPIDFGDVLLTPPANARSWTTTVDLRPATDLLVRVEAGLEGSSAVWKFTSLDPATLTATTDAVAGFLPPNKVAPEGQGGVSYSVAPVAGVATGTVVGGDASIVFDTNAAIVTNVWSNLLDDTAPAAAVQSAVVRDCGVDVAWGGTDAGSGIASYDVWMSEDGGAWRPVAMRTAGTSARVPAEAGRAYRFDVQARDFAGNLQAAERGDARAVSADCSAPVVDPGDGQIIVEQPGPPSGPGPGGGGAPQPAPKLAFGRTPVSVKLGKVTRRAVTVTLTSRERFAFTGTATLRVGKALSRAAKFSLGKPAKVTLRPKAPLKRGRTKVVLRLALVAPGGVKKTVDVKLTVRVR
ncbi:hypothetical protein OJ997_11430 [Solirubrobacter phytolaccae]|uniref:Calx-beta domain-containing protein n=1 Tax=Solirubrobacter phytolaccae TaxID=1404360 RepID=A0A9X3N9W7_9ACTN|nr:hypothetical protein [Solirubrobacter phytolaccae]MDA0180907.1 hypothetical protein [Solirubrobacter phytolaccae]